jgi:hypothetical protein
MKVSAPKFYDSFRCPEISQPQTRYAVRDDEGYMATSTVFQPHLRDPPPERMLDKCRY